LTRREKNTKSFIKQPKLPLERKLHQQRQAGETASWADATRKGAMVDGQTKKGSGDAETTSTSALVTERPSQRKKGG